MIHFQQLRWAGAGGWSELRSSRSPSSLVDLIVVFGGRSAMAAPEPIAELQARYPGALVAGCSTAGEILNPPVRPSTMPPTARPGSELGRCLAAQLAAPDLVHVLLFADGIGVNGSELVRGIEAGLAKGVSVTGGLAGDGGRFQQTLVRWGTELSTSGIVGIGFYGHRLRVGHGSLGGWDPFGPDRRITRSRGNVLYELDNRPALDLYRLYLGEHATGLRRPACSFR